MKTVTALGINNINYEVLKNMGYEIIGKDIIYQDGIFEALEIYKSTEELIISDNLPGNYTFEELIKKITEKYDKIEISVFLEDEDYNKKMFLNSYGIYKIYCLKDYEIKYRVKGNTNNIEDFKTLLQSKMRNQKMGLVEQNSYNISKSNIIAIYGTPGSGKTVLTGLIAKVLADKGKVVIFSLDDGRNGINTLIGLDGKFVRYKYFDVQNFVSCESADNKELDKEQKKKYFYEFFENAKKNYDYILIDIGESPIELRHMAIEFSKNILFVTEPNVLCIKKAKVVLEENELIDSEKVKIIVNKYSRYSIKKNLLKEIFYRYELAEIIEYSDQIEYLINKNFNKSVLEDEMREIARMIIERRNEAWNY